MLYLYSLIWYKKYVRCICTCIVTCTCIDVHYLILLSLHTITVLPLTTVYIVSEVHCT